MLLLKCKYLSFKQTPKTNAQNTHVCSRCVNDWNENSNYCCQLSERIDLIPCVLGTADLENVVVSIIFVCVKYAHTHLICSTVTLL